MGDEGAEPSERKKWGQGEGKKSNVSEVQADTKGPSVGVYYLFISVPYDVLG